MLVKSGVISCSDTECRQTVHTLNSVSTFQSKRVIDSSRTTYQGEQAVGTFPDGAQ